MKNVCWIAFITGLVLLVPTCAKGYGDIEDVRDICGELPAKTVFFVMTDNIGQTAQGAEQSSIGSILKLAEFNEVLALPTEFGKEFKQNAGLANDFSFWDAISRSKAQVWLALIDVDSKLETVIAIEYRTPSKLGDAIIAGLGWDVDSEVFKEVDIRKLPSSAACMFALNERLYFTSNTALAKSLVAFDKGSRTETLASTRKFQRCANLQKGEFDVWYYCDPTLISRMYARNIRENSPAAGDQFFASNLGEILAVFGSLAFSNSSGLESVGLTAEMHALLAVPNRRLARLLAFKGTSQLEDAFLDPADCDALARISFDFAELLRGAEETVDSSSEANTYRSQFVDSFEQQFGIDVEEFVTKQLTGDVEMYYRQTNLNDYMGIPFDFAIKVRDEKAAGEFLRKMSTSEMNRGSRELTEIRGIPVWKDKQEIVERRKEGIRKLRSRSGQSEETDPPVPQTVMSVFNEHIFNSYSMEDLEGYIDAWKNREDSYSVKRDWLRVDDAMSRLAGNESVSARVYFRNGVQYKYFYDHLKSGNAVSAFTHHSYPPKLVQRVENLQATLRKLPRSKDLLRSQPAAGAFLSGNPREGHIALTFFELKDSNQK